MRNFIILGLAACAIGTAVYLRSNQDDPAVHELLEGITAPFWPRPNASPNSGPSPSPDDSTRPSPGPTPRQAHSVVYITSDNCSWCRKLEADWPSGFGVPTTKANLDRDREIREKYQPAGVPCLIALDASGKEMRRQLGWANKDKIRAFLAGN